MDVGMSADRHLRAVPDREECCIHVEGEAFVGCGCGCHAAPPLTEANFVAQMNKLAVANGFRAPFPEYPVEVPGELE